MYASLVASNARVTQRTVSFAYRSFISRPSRSNRPMIFRQQYFILTAINIYQVFEKNDLLSFFVFTKKKKTLVGESRSSLMTSMKIYRAQTLSLFHLPTHLSLNHYTIVNEFSWKMNIFQFSSDRSSRRIRQSFAPFWSGIHSFKRFCFCIARESFLAIV